jgi:tRNA pseudouridine38-40 synthase
MQRYKITVEYNGYDFHGWQEQKGLRSVQQTIQDAILQFSREAVTVYGAGRTDAGVHSTGQVAHFDLQNPKDPNEVCRAINHFLKNDNIAILRCETVPKDFHARFSATSRSYVYKIINRRAHLTTQKGFAWHVIEPLDTTIMNEAAQHLIGFHDFESFRSTQCQSRSSLKSIDIIRVEMHGGNIDIFISARSFLHNQVRIIVGTLRKVGNGSWNPYKVVDILKSKDRSAAGQTAPPYGLYLTLCTYQ